MDSLWLLSIKLFFSLLFLITSWHKGKDINHFATVIAKYHLLPVAHCYAVAYLLVGLEIITVILLWLLPILGGIFILVLLITYTLAIMINLYKGRVIMDCGCGGIPIRLRPSLLIRNIFLGSLAATLLASSNLREITFIDITIAILVSTILLTIYLLVEQLLANREQFVVPRSIQISRRN